MFNAQLNSGTHFKLLRLRYRTLWSHSRPENPSGRLRGVAPAQRMKSLVRCDAKDGWRGGKSWWRADGEESEGAGRRYFSSGTSSFLPADMSDSRPFATVGSCVTPAGAPSSWLALLHERASEWAHLLSRLDRPPVTHHAVKPWPGVFEMWQHNQFPWFMTGLREAERVERVGSWKRSADGECWRQRLADVYSGGGSSSWRRCPILARPSSELRRPCGAILILQGESCFYSREKNGTSGSATVQWRFPPGARVARCMQGYARHFGPSCRRPHGDDDGGSADSVETTEPWSGFSQRGRNSMWCQFGWVL